MQKRENFKVNLDGNWAYPHSRKNRITTSLLVETWIGHTGIKEKWISKFDGMGLGHVRNPSRNGARLGARQGNFLFWNPDLPLFKVKEWGSKGHTLMPHWSLLDKLPTRHLMFMERQVFTIAHICMQVVWARRRRSSDPSEVICAPTAEHGCLWEEVRVQAPTLGGW